MSRQLQCVVITPERRALDEIAEYVALPLYDGEIGITRGHAPLIGRLGFGELRLRQRGRDVRYYVDGGFVHVADNEISVLTPEAVPIEEIREDDARQLLDDALKLPVKSPADEQIRDRTLARARGRLRVARR